ncbi:MAG: hypothetical protein BWY23_01757 [Spirochaetes bacterium ADurb.Bin218]|jgi:hypothetical protein|nr:MAG: hypothetical protein BWY23_01757 [Spirochaetes bacterium ADurb.Bin218]HOQ11620.1 hypothetical protein [Spirochaetota bacterium]
MSLWTEIKRNIYKYGEIALHKSEIAIQVAKYKVALKKKEIEITHIKSEIGDYVIGQFENQMKIDDDVIAFHAEKIKSIKKDIAELQKKYDEAKNNLFNQGTETNNSAEKNE